MDFGAAEADFECAGGGEVLLGLEDAAAGQGDVVGQFDAEDEPIVEVFFEAQTHGHAQEDAGVVGAQSVGEFDAVGAHAEEEIGAEMCVAPGIVEEVEVADELIGVACAGQIWDGQAVAAGLGQLGFVGGIGVVDGTLAVARRSSMP